MILAGLGEGIEIRASLGILAHVPHAFGDRDLVVHQPREGEGVPVEPFAAAENPLEEVPIEVSGLSRVDPAERIFDRRPEVFQIPNLVAVYFPPRASHQHSVGPNRGVIHGTDEVEYSLLASEIEVRDELRVAVKSFLGGRVAVPVGASDNHLGECSRDDLGGLISDTEKATDEADAVVPVADRYLRLKDFAEFSVANELNSGRVQRLKAVLFGNLDLCPAFDEVMEFNQMGDIRSGRGLREDRDTAISQRLDDDRVALPGNGSDREVRPVGRDLIDRVINSNRPGFSQLGGAFRPSRKYSRDFELLREFPGDPEKELGAPPRTDNRKTKHANLSLSDPDQTPTLRPAPIQEIRRN